MKNVAIIEMGILVEIKFEKTKLKTFKTERGLKNHLHNTVFNFLNELKTFNDIDLCKVNQLYNCDYSEINDFDYSYYNLVPKTENYIVYRLFGFSLLGLTENPKTDFINQTFNTKKFDIKIQNSSFGTYKNKNV
jgi:hypothetical protein